MDNNSSGNNVNNNTSGNVPNNARGNHQEKPSLLSKIGKGLSKANNLRKDYQQAGGLGNFAKNAVKNKINDKVQDTKDNAKSAIKNKIGGMVPDSVKQKQQALKQKQQALNDKLHAPQKKLQEGKAKLNEQVFRKGVKAAVDAVAPGTGTIAEKLLDTPKGQPAIEAARAASNPASAIVEGGKTLAKIVVSFIAKRQLLSSLLPPLVGVVAILVVIISLFGKFGDGLHFALGSPNGQGGPGMIVDEKYKKFYEYLDSKGGSNKMMVLAVLTAYQDNDIYGANGDYSDSADFADDDEEMTVEPFNGNSNAQMKKYIKKVAKQIKESNNDVSEGDYANPGSTGSDFFQWLYNEFLEDYYAIYLESLSGDTLAKKKVEILRAIYLYYKEIKGGNKTLSPSYVSASCPNGVTVTGDGAGTYDLEEYIAGVVAHENCYYVGDNIESMKAQAIAARTYALKKTENCTKSIVNSQTAQTFFTPEEVSKTCPKAKIATEETKGKVLLYDGKIFLSEYSSFKGTCSGGSCSMVLTKIPGTTTHTVTIPSSYVYNNEGHTRGMSQLAANWLQKEKGFNYEQILKYFYDDSVEIGTNSAVFSGNTALPIQAADVNTWYSTYISRGYQLGTATCYRDGVAIGTGCDHLGLDFGNNVSSGTPIYAIADGVVDTAINGTTGYGKYIILSHDVNGDGSTDYYSLYAHQSELLVNKGDTVAGGTQIGKVGTTGNSTGNHLHFEISICKTHNRSCKLDPKPFLDSIVAGKGMTE